MRIKGAATPHPSPPLKRNSRLLPLRTLRTLLTTLKEVWLWQPCPRMAAGLCRRGRRFKNKYHHHIYIRRQQWTVLHSLMRCPIPRGEDPQLIPLLTRLHILLLYLIALHHRWQPWRWHGHTLLLLLVVAHLRVVPPINKRKRLTASLRVHNQQLLGRPLESPSLLTIPPFLQLSPLIPLRPNVPLLQQSIHPHRSLLSVPPLPSFPRARAIIPKNPGRPQAHLKVRGILFTRAVLDLVELRGSLCII